MLERDFTFCLMTWNPHKLLNHTGGRRYVSVNCTLYFFTLFRNLYFPIVLFPFHIKPSRNCQKKIILILHVQFVSPEALIFMHGLLNM